MSAVDLKLVKECVRDVISSTKEYGELKVKAVRRLIEKKLSLPKKGLDEYKDEVKSLLRDEIISRQKKEAEKEAEKEMKANNTRAATKKEKEVKKDLKSTKSVAKTQKRAGEKVPKVEKASDTDPEPKHSMTSYMLFNQEIRDSIQQENPSMKMLEISKVVGTKWAALSDNEKEKYKKLSEEDKSRYAKEMEAWRARNPEKKTKSELKKEKKEAKSGLAIPKKSSSAVSLFCSEKREEVQKENSSLSKKEVTQLLKKQWRALDTSEKKVYEDLAEEDKKRYETEAYQYEKDKLHREKKAARAKLPHADSAYIIFCKHHRDAIRKQHEDWKMIDVTKELGSMWKKASKKEIDECNKLHEEEKKRVEQEINEMKEKGEYDSVLDKKVDKAAMKKQKIKRVSGYNMYMKERCASLKDEDTEKKVSFRDKSAMIAGEWKAMSKDNKEKYEEMAKAKNAEPQSEKKTKKISVPSSAMALFFKEYRNTLKNELKGKELKTALKAAWTELKADDKIAYENKYHELKIKSYEE